MRRIRIKDCLLKHSGGIWGDDPVQDRNDILCVRVADFDYQNLSIKTPVETIRNIPASQQTSRTLKKGDILLEKSGGGEKTPVGRAVMFNEDFAAVCSNFIERLELKSVVHPRYFVYLLSSLYQNGIVGKYIKQTTGIQNLDVTAFLGEYIYLPSMDEQLVLVKKLDSSMELTFRAIMHKEKLVEKLSEERSAIIHHAVTHGLDEDVEYLESGVEWIGGIPKGWKMRKFKHLGSFLSGGTPETANLSYWNGDIPWVSPKDMKGEVISSTEDMITELGLANSAGTLIPPQSLLLVYRSGILKHSLPTATNEVSVAVNQDIKVLIPNNEVRADYLRYFVSGNVNNLLNKWRKLGATVESLDHTSVANTEIPIPSIQEQAKIVDTLKISLEQIDGAISSIIQSIHLINEYRESLVSHLTGHDAKLV